MLGYDGEEEVSEEEVVDKRRRSVVGQVAVDFFIDLQKSHRRAPEQAGLAHVGGSRRLGAHLQPLRILVDKQRTTVVGWGKLLRRGGRRQL